MNSDVVKGKLKQLTGEMKRKWQAHRRRYNGSQW